MLEFHSGSSGAVNSRRAVAECLESAHGRGDLDCDLIIFYTTMGHNFGELLDEMHRLSPRARIVGCTCAGVIGREGPNESMRALAVMAVRGPRSEIAVAGQNRITKASSYEVARGLAQDLRRENPGVSAILFHPSGLAVFPEKAIEGIESVFGPEVPIIGGLPMDNTQLVSDFEFLDDRRIEQGAVAVGFADPTIEVVAQANHGLTIVGDPMHVTKADGNRVLEIDGLPARTAWAARLGLPATASAVDVIVAPLVRELPGETHEEYDSGFAVIVYAGSYPADTTIHSSECCPVGTKLWLTRREEREVFAGLDRMMRRIVQRCGGRRPVAVLQADCNSRGRLLFNRVLKEEIVSRMQGPLCKDEEVPWLGMYGGGELAPLGGRNRIHAFTTSLYLLLRRDE